MGSMVQVRLSFAPWLPLMIEIMTQLMIMGYRIDDGDFGRLVESALIVEAE